MNAAAPAPRAFTFDDQATSFDRRTGLPEDAVRRIADAVVEIAGPAAGGVLELGAGTGEIGVRLAAEVDAYAGFDVSLPMLGRFCQRYGRRRRVASRIFLADADRPWPVRDGWAKAFFASRAAHLLDARHLIAEVRRTARPEGACLILGRVARERDSLRSCLRRELHQLLLARGVEARGGRRHRRHLVELCAAAGGVAETRLAAAWPVEERPAAALQAWRSKAGLAGRSVDPEIRRDVLARLESWARERYGDLETVRAATESYELTVIRWAARPA